MNNLNTNKSKIWPGVVLPLASGIAMLIGAQAQAADEAFQRSVEERLAKLEAKEESAPALPQNLTFAGLVEVEAAVGEADEESYSDLALATVELGLGAQINDKVSVNVVALYEEDTTELDIDTATITIDKLVGPVALDLGKMYVPFGRYETAMVNDSLALEAGETNKTAALFRLEQGIFGAGVYAFNGDADREEHVENGGVTFTVGNDDMHLGVDYINALTEADGWSEQVWVEHPEAYSVSGRLALGIFTLLAEYLSATDEMLAETLVGEPPAEGFEPEVAHVEANVDLTWGSQPFTVALAWQQTNDVVGYLPEERVSMSARTDVYENVTLAAEIWHDEDYSVDDGGTGGDSDNLVLQLAVSF